MLGDCILRCSEASYSLQPRASRGPSPFADRPGPRPRINAKARRMCSFVSGLATVSAGFGLGSDTDSGSYLGVGHDNHFTAFPWRSWRRDRSDELDPTNNWQLEQTWSVFIYMQNQPYMNKEFLIITDVAVVGQRRRSFEVEVVEIVGAAKEPGKWRSSFLASQPQQPRQSHRCGAATWEIRPHHSQTSPIVCLMIILSWLSILSSVVRKQ